MGKGFVYHVPVLHFYVVSPYATTFLSSGVYTTWLQQVRKETSDLGRSDK